MIAGSGADAAGISSMRSFSNHDKTRIVLDLTGKLEWSQARQKDGRLIVRVKNPDNLKNVPQLGALDSKSCVTGGQRLFDGKDVRYVFMSQTCGSPNVFLLTPSSGGNWRLVADFPHTGSSLPVSDTAGKAAAGTAKTASTQKTLKQLEQELFVKYSSADSAGLRSMTPAQAREYDAALAKLRADYQERQVLGELNSETKAAAKTDSRGATARTDTKNATAGNGSKTTAKSATAVAERDTEEVKDTAAPPAAVAVKAIARPFIIAIDPGHGGKDPGAKGKRGVREKDVTLAIAKHLVSYINSDKRLRGVLTRSRDRYIDLDARSNIARKQKAELLISIHCNSTPKATTARGTEVLLLSSNRAQRENAKIVRTGSSGNLTGGAGKVIGQAQDNPYLETMVVDMSSQNTRSEGYELASEILGSIGKFTRLHKKKPVYASLAVLKAPDIPSLLIETGFLSNKYEEIQLNQPNYQKQMAYRIFQGIRSYYEKYPLSDFKSRVDSDKRNAQAASYASYKVQKGDYLSKIAQKHGISVGELKKINELKSDTVRVGQVLKVPKS